MKSDLYRELPAVDELLRSPELAHMIKQEGQAPVGDACRTVLARIRTEISSGHLDERKLAIALKNMPAAIQQELDRALSYSLRSVINATGVILHTNLGRAPLAQTAIEHIRETAGLYSNLEFDIDSGDRGKRDMHVDRLLSKLLSEVNPHTRVASIVVNNNAAAVLLALNTLADGGEVIVSRGELVEIGGSFRIPEVMAKSGAILREVGTTNRTRIGDYEQAINERTKLILRVHRSNFEISGFTEQPQVTELVALAARHKLPVMEDLGSGALFDLHAIGIEKEFTALDSLRVGAHVVTYSGDKLLGGPQAGIISGCEDLVQRMRGNSLFRALRVDKLTYAALEATLLAYVKRNYDAVPALGMMQLSKSEITERAERLTTLLGNKKEGARMPQLAQMSAELVHGESLIGGGSAPSAVLPTTLIALTSTKLTANELAVRLRSSDPPVIARVEDGRVLLDLRTVFPSQDDLLRQTLLQITA